MYSFYPHDAGFAASSVIQPAYELNCPPLIVPDEADREPLARIAADNVIIETVKPCEDGERAFILRIYEARTSEAVALPPDSLLLK